MGVATFSLNISTLVFLRGRARRLCDRRVHAGCGWVVAAPGG